MRNISFKKAAVIFSLLVFFTFFTFFVIILAQGKTFNKEGEIVDTGIIRINSIPTDVTVYINGEQVKKTENRIEGVEPGEITIKLEKEGYSPWEKIVTVGTGIVKDIYAQLFPENLKFQQITNTNVDNAFFSDNIDYIFYTLTDPEMPGKVGIWRMKLISSIFDFGSVTPEQFVSFNESLLKTVGEYPYTIQAANDNNKILLNIPKKKILYVYNTSQKNAKLDIVKEIGFYPNQIKWHKDSDTLLVEQDSLLFEYNLSTKTFNLITYTPDKKPLYSHSNEKLFYYKPETSEIWEYENGHREIIKLPKAFKVNGDLISIHSPVYNNNILIIQKISGLYFIDIDKKFVEKISNSGVYATSATNGTSVLYKEDDLYFTYKVEETLDGSSYESAIKQIELTSTPLSIYFAANSSNLIALTIEEEEKNLILMDFDGLNPRQIVSEQSIFGNNPQMINDGTEMYLLLIDSIPQTEDESTQLTKNIYKLDLSLE